MDIEINSAAPADLIAVLAKAGLAAHVGAFVDEGYEELGYLRELAAAANEVMGIEPVVGPLPLQVERLNEAVGIDI